MTRRVPGLRLSPRLQMVADLVPAASCAADIGTDHAYVPAALILQGKAARCIAMDVRPGPLERARQTLLRYGLTDRIELRLSDGFAALAANEADQAILAGMGGILMRDLLARADASGVLSSLKGLTLQPQSDAQLVRGWLWDHGWSVDNEDMTEDAGKYYTAMAAVPGRSTAPTDMDEADALYGPVLIRTGHPVLVTWLTRRREVLKERLSGTTSPAYRKALYEELDRVENVLERSSL